MSSPLFSAISFYKDAQPFAFAMDGYLSATPAHGTWPTPFGGAARISRIDEPLLQDTWRVQWKAELGEATRAQSLLLGAGRVVVNGSERRGVWLTDGTPVATFPRQAGAVFLDIEGAHIVCAAPGGLETYSFEGAREAVLPLSLAEAATLREILLGPGAFVFVSNQNPPQASSRVVVECMRIVDYQRIENRILYGVEPLAGVKRSADGKVAAAAGNAGPVLATSDGVLFCDWQLRNCGEVALSTIPLALSVDDFGRALLVSDDYGEIVFRAVSPPRADGGATSQGIAISIGSEFASAHPPVVAKDGQIYVCSEHALFALSPAGQVLWRQARECSAPAVVTQNGLVLLADDQLYAVVSDGRRVPLWKPPHPIRTAAVLAGGLIFVATDSELFALEPA